MRIDWPNLFKRPQTYVLVVGTGLGYALFLSLAGARPIAWLSGGGIAAVMVGSWAAGFRMAKPAEPVAEDLLDAAMFAQRLRQLEQAVPKTSNATWQQVSTWATNSQQFAVRICDRDPLLRTELLEAMYTVTDLANQVAEALKIMDDIQTPAYQQVAQQRLKASCDRMEETYVQLQQLQDQVMLSSLDATTASLPRRLQTLVAANKQILQTDFSQTDRPNSD